MTRALSPALREHGAQLARFALVGGSAVALDFAVYFALVTFAPLVPTSVAKAASFVAGAVLSFLLNRGFVFRSSQVASRQALPFALLYLVTLALNNGVNAALLSLHAAKLLAWFCATGASTMGNFVGMKFLVFRRTKTP